MFEVGLSPPGQCGAMPSPGHSARPATVMWRRSAGAVNVSECHVAKLGLLPPTGHNATWHRGRRPGPLASEWRALLFRKRGSPMFVIEGLQSPPTPRPTPLRRSARGALGVADHMPSPRVCGRANPTLCRSVPAILSNPQPSRAFPAEAAGQFSKRMASPVVHEDAWNLTPRPWDVQS